MKHCTIYSLLFSKYNYCFPKQLYLLCLHDEKNLEILKFWLTLDYANNKSQMNETFSVPQIPG